MNFLLRFTNVSFLDLQAFLKAILSFSVPDNFVLKLFSLPPFTQTWKAKAVITIRHNPKSGLTFGLVHHDFHANPTGSIFGFSHGKGLLHLRFVLFHASKLVHSTLLFVVWMEDGLLTHITDESMDVGAIFAISTDVHDAEGTQLRFGFFYRHFGHGFRID